MIAGRYRLDAQIGAGAMGVVWRATDTELGRVVAIKQSRVGDHGQIRREARVGAGLHHPNVVTVFDSVLDGEDRWLVMEYLPSRTLGALIDEQGSLPPVEVARIGTQLANAVAAMHDLEMVHRDIKPGNVLIGDNGVAKLTDLGIARWADVTATGSGQMVGTPAYIAPEVADGHEASAPADIYSLGATLFAAVEGTSPTGSGDQGPYVQMRRAAAGNLEPMKKAGPLEPVLRALLAKDPADRPNARTAKEMLDELAGQSVPLTWLPMRRSRRRKTAIGAGAAVLAVALIAVGSVYVFGDSEPRPPVITGSLGDARTADPCGLINLNTGSKFGVLSTLDAEYGGYTRCGMLIKQTHNDQDLVDARVQISLPEEYPAQPRIRGQLGQVERPAEKKNYCERKVALADENLLTVAASHKQDMHAPLCSIAEAMMTDALAVLSTGPVPRRKEAFAPGALGTAEACKMLTPEEVAEDTATGLPASEFRPEPDVGDWTCWWGEDPVEVDLEFKREYPLDEEDGRPIKVAGKDAFLEVNQSGDDEHDTCVVDVVHRQYEKDTAFNKTWQEIASLTLETEEKISPDALCAKATKLAERMVVRLPKV